MQNNSYDLIIIGAGASGLMAATEAGRLGLKTLVLEGHKSAGAKILMSGGARCNVTNAIVTEKDYASECPRLVRHVLQTLRPEETVAFFTHHGVPLQEEEGGKYFPVSGSAKDVLKALLEAVKKSGVTIRYGSLVRQVEPGKMGFFIQGDDMEYSAKAVLVATGGLSYPGTGSNGFGLKVAKGFGHTIVATSPALTPLKTDDVFWHGLMGIAVPCRVALWKDGHKILDKEGPILFTHTGFSGPVIFDISRFWERSQGGALTVDFCPGLKGRSLSDALQGPRNVRNALRDFLPERLVLALLTRANVLPGKLFTDLSNKEKKALQETLLACALPVSGIAGYEKAEVTAGGVDLRELKGASLESKLQPGLFFCGEVLDVDGRVGGFNLQWAWASGIAAARGIAKTIKG